MRARMKLNWEFLPHRPALRLEHVLDCGNNGPVVASFVEDGRRFIGVACDREWSVTRWIEAEISLDDWRCLLRGDMSLRSALTGTSVWVVDRDVELREFRAWHVPFSCLLDCHLPDENSYFDPDEHAHLIG